MCISLQPGNASDRTYSELTMQTLQFSALKKNLKKDFSALPKIRLAILGDSSTQLLMQGMKGYGYEQQINFDIYEADYDQIDLQVLNPESELYVFEPEFILMYFSVQKLQEKYFRTDAEKRAQFADNFLNKVKSYIETVNSRISSRILITNFAEQVDSVFGNYASRVEGSFLYQLRKINFRLMELAGETSNLFLNDIAVLQHRDGVQQAFDPKVYVSTSITTSMEFLPVMIKNTVDIIRAVQGKIKKCLILDLDNTTWGGVIGDDGVDGIQVGDLGIGKAFTELQRWAKNLKDRGIILAICSKNTDSVAREPFEKHPDMVLRLEDIAIFVANWENKADNIRHIQSVLNIGFDSMVFLDDNPFERNLVRSELPEVTVPELPADPTEYMPYIRTLNLFETGSYSPEDAARTKKYQEEAGRVQLQQQFTSLDDYLKGLEMEGTIREFDEFHIPRIAQLTQRSNQFNLRTVRYDEQQIREVMDANDRTGIYIKLEDKFGAYGLISLLILDQQGTDFFIDTWVMSCRVLKRDVEKFVLNALVETARIKGCNRLVGEYLPTPKNKLVENHYENLGFKPEGSKWILEVDDYSPLNCHIKAI